jgi:death-on-curing protein
MNFPTVEEIIKIHEGVLLKIGGSSGLRDAHALAMCAKRPHAAFGGKDMYPTLFLKAAAAMETIARNHPFVDGNKRTAFMTALYIIENNKYKTTFDQNDIKESTVRSVVEKTSIEEIAKWLEQNSKSLS